jgi:hypothetical protein
MLCGALFGKSPFVSTPLAHLTTDESLEAVSIPID